jgi:hypothetical protein
MPANGHGRGPILMVTLITKSGWNNSIRQKIICSFHSEYTLNTTTGLIQLANKDKIDFVFGVPAYGTIRLLLDDSH